MFITLLIEIWKFGKKLDFFANISKTFEKIQNVQFKLARSGLACRKYSENTFCLLIKKIFRNLQGSIDHVAFEKEHRSEDNGMYISRQQMYENMFK